MKSTQSSHPFVSLRVFQAGLFRLSRTFCLLAAMIGCLAIHELSYASAATICRGDVNGDGLIDTADVVAALQSVAGLETALCKSPFKDFNGDNAVGLIEAINALQVCANKKTAKCGLDADSDGYPDLPGDALTDCDDASGDIHPGVDDSAADGIDSNCDGKTNVQSFSISGVSFDAVSQGLDFEGAFRADIEPDGIRILESEGFLTFSEIEVTSDGTGLFAFSFHASVDDPSSVETILLTNVELALNDSVLEQFQIAIFPDEPAMTPKDALKRVLANEQSFATRKTESIIESHFDGGQQVTQYVTTYEKEGGYLRHDFYLTPDMVEAEYSIIYTLSTMTAVTKENGIGGPMDLAELKDGTAEKLEASDMINHFDEFMQNHTLSILDMETWQRLKAGDFDTFLVEIEIRPNDFLQSLYDKKIVVVDYLKGLITKAYVFKDGEVAEREVAPLPIHQHVDGVLWMPQRKITTTYAPAGTLVTYSELLNAEINIDIPDAIFDPNNMR